LRRRGVSQREAATITKRLVAGNDEETEMRKLLIAAAVAAVGAVGFAGRADAQAFYPKTPHTNVPARVQGAYGTQGAYGYPGQYPSYPGQYPQYPTTSNRRYDDRGHVRRDRDRDDDDRSRDDRYDRRSNYGYGSRSTSGYDAPSRVADHDATSRSRSTWNDNRRNERSNHYRRDGR
jgi:hypothetical protein